MWFKNLQIYRLPADWGILPGVQGIGLIGLATLEEQLARGTFQPCPAHRPASRGWMSPRPESGLVYSNNRQWLLALATEERLLPASVINKTMLERAEKVADEQGYPPGRKQMKELRERITEELMPRAFTRLRTTHAWIDPVNGWLVIDAGSPAKAEEVIEHLRFCLDDFPLKPLLTQRSPQSAMAEWLAGGSAPTGFTIDRDCELKSVAEEKAAVRYVRHSLDGNGMDEQVRTHLAAGKLPTRLALTWDERISFILTEKLEIKRLAFLDILKEEAGKGVKNAADQFDADFALMTGELARFLPCLVEALGGEQ